MITVKREGVIIEPSMVSYNENNINGPSLIKVPDWIENPLGKYYLYFANHGGKYIRMAYSDKVTGPYTIHENGTLRLEQSPGHDHIASPDVHIDNENKEIVMYYHTPFEDWQYTFKSKSKNGLEFTSEKYKLGMFYFRVFKFNDRIFAIAKNKNTSGISYELINNEWVVKDENFIPNMRHSAVNVVDDILEIYYSLVGDLQEKIYLCKIKLDKDVDKWEVISNEVFIKPEFKWEGILAPMIESKPGTAFDYVNQLRDPHFFENEHDDKFLLYSVAGEKGIGISRIN